ncbi:MAG TPA: SMP-30/gluconolactonase/LRE family protein [Chloroflexia bacterium]|nr:SMP-30/gluconolactonase/LRE family protein [Chloroflexia bacterium]
MSNLDIPKARPPIQPWLPADEAVWDSPDEAGPPLLPEPGPSADLPTTAVPRRWTLLVFAITLVVYLVLIPRFLLYSSPPTGDQPFYMMDTISLLKDGDLILNNNYADRDERIFYELAPHHEGFVGMSAPYPLPPQLGVTPAKPEEEWYAAHLPGLSVLIIPAWLIGELFQLWWPATVVFMCILGALLATNVFLLGTEITGKRWIGLAVWLPLAFSTPLMSYSYLLFTELPVGLLMVYALRRLALGWSTNGPWRLLLIGFCIGYIPWLAFRCAPIAGVLGIYALVQWWRAWRQRPAAGKDEPTETDGVKWPSRPPPRFVWQLGVLLLPVAIAGVVLALFNLNLHGTILPAGGGSITRGQESLFHWPWRGQEELAKWLNGVFGTFIDRNMGLFTNAPIYVLSLVGIVAMFRSGLSSARRLLILMAFLVVPYMTVISAYEWWNGVWCPPARYWNTFVPLLAALLAASLAALANSWFYKALYVVLALPGFYFQAITMYDARHMWPSQAILGRPPSEWPFNLNVRDFVPLFTPIDEYVHPSATAQVVAVAVAIAFIGYILLVRRRGVPRLPFMAHGAIWAVSLMTVGAGWYSMNLDYLQHKTQLVEQHRWALDPVPRLPRGIGYLDGKVYITDYDGNAVGQLDTATGAYKLVEPRKDGGPLPFKRPGDVKVGADGLLYVLNNDQQPHTMYVMQPDGTVVKELVLAGKSEVAVGLYFTPDGTLYLADMRGAQVRKYTSDGSGPVSGTGGETGGFNNVVGVVVEPDGTIYAAESSANRVQRLDAEGKFVRDYDLPCQPMYLVSAGDWLEVSCGQSIFSINKATGVVQRSQTAPDTPRLQNPLGMTYGPDGILYIVDRDAVVAYRVEH